MWRHTMLTEIKNQSWEAMRVLIPYDTAGGKLWSYFRKNFRSLDLDGLAKITFSSDPREIGKTVVVTTFNGIEEFSTRSLGDFRTCKEIMRISDCVVAVPPPSVFLETIEQSIIMGQDFFILGKETYEEHDLIRPLIESNSIRTVEIRNGLKWFISQIGN